MNLPGVVVDLPTLTEKDIGDIQNWGVKVRMTKKQNQGCTKWEE